MSYSIIGCLCLRCGESIASFRGVEGAFLLLSFACNYVVSVRIAFNLV